MSLSGAEIYKFFCLFHHLQKIALVEYTEQGLTNHYPDTWDK